MTSRESEHCIVPLTSGNAERGKAVPPTRNANNPSTIRSVGQQARPASVNDRLRYIHERAQSQPNADFSNVFHLLKYELLWHAFRKLKRNKAPGADGVSVEDYEANLQSNLQDLESRLQRGAYQKRLGRFGLRLAEEKSKLLRFGRFAERDCREANEGKPGVFDFLGFTHYCGHSRAGKFKLKRKTAKKKFRQKLQAMKEWLRTNLTTPIDQVWLTLNRKLQGHYQYYGVSDNWDYLLSYRDKVIEFVSRWVARRSQRSMSKTDFFKQYSPSHPLAKPRRLTSLYA